MRISTKGVYQRVCHLRHRCLLVQIAFFLRIRDKAHLKEDGRASRFEQHPERCLLHAPVGTVEMTDKAFLHLLRELERLVHETVLHQLEHNIRINGIGVETLISGLIIRLQFHHSILTHRHVEVFLHLLRSENEGFHTFGFLAGRSVRVDGDKEVRVVLVGYIRARLERNKLIRCTGIYHFHVRILLFQQFSHFEDER